MHWLDWFLILFPLLIVFYIGLKSQKYVKTVADFLAAGRVAGRYVISVASGEASFGLISLVGMWEQYYMVGFAIEFWGKIGIALGIIMGLTGYCNYRFRETGALTMGQFLEMRYNRAFRVFAAVLQTVSGIMNFAIFPAIGARCMMYFLNLPVRVSIGGWVLSTYGLLMVLFLSIAVCIVTMGGQITIMVTDCVQGLLSYPFYAVIVFWIIWRFSWNGEIVPVLQDTPPGKSMLNPFDVSRLTTFNLFYVSVGLFSSIFNRMAWSGSQGYNAAARNAHEQKMGGLLAYWRNGFSWTMYVLLAVAAYTYMHHAHFTKEADHVHQQLALKTQQEIVYGERYDAIRDDVHALVERGEVTSNMKDILEKSGKFDLSKPLGADQYRAAIQAAVSTVDKGKAVSMGTLYNQMLVPVAVREMLPMGLTGMLGALMIFLMVSTDTTYMHSWGSIIVQDIILPFRKTPFTPKQQLNLLRCVIAGVAVFAFFFSFFFSQMDYIQMFFAITGAIWLGGGGSVIVFGLYWKRGTTAGAFAALISGSMLAVGGILCQQTWAKYLYPFLERKELVARLDHLLVTISRPFNPYIAWSMNPDRFPINSREIYFIAMVVAILLYVIFSLITCRKPFDMDRLLHRGAYSNGETKPAKMVWSFRNVFGKMIGIDSNYSRGDKILAWSVFIYSFIYGFVIMFIGIVIWNVISPWPNEWWAVKFYVTSVILPCIVALVSTVWFSIGGTLDLHRLFKDLANKEDDFTDDGRVNKA